MIEIDFSLWKQFANSGKIDDYLAYKMIKEDFAEEQGDALYN